MSAANSENSPKISGDLSPDQLVELIREAWRKLQSEKNKEWQRTLPFGDYFVDRWEKAGLLNFGEGTSIYDSSVVLGDVQIGENTFVGPFTVLDGSGGLTIGSHCSIAAGVQIYTHDSIRWALSGGKEDYDKAPTKIGDRCYLAPNTIVSKGVTIGDGCVIGANSLVLNDLPAGSKAAGNPCRILGKAE